MPNEEEYRDGDQDTPSQFDHELLKKDLDKALEDMLDSMHGYKKAENYYNGDIEEKFISRDLRKMLSGSENEFLVNLTRKVVTAVSDRLEISAITAKDKNAPPPPSPEEVAAEQLAAQQHMNNAMVDASGNPVEAPGTVAPNGVPTPPSPQGPAVGVSPEILMNQKLLFTKSDSHFDEDFTRILNEDIWHANELDIEAPELHLRALIYGDAYLFVWENEEGDGVDMFYNSPITTRLFYHDENPRKKKFAIKRWLVGSGKDKTVRMDIYYPDFIIKKKSKGKTRGERAGEFVPYIDETTDEFGVAENPFGVIPIFHFRTSPQYGEPEHEQGYGPQDAITKLISSQMTSTDFAAFPQRYATSRDTADTDTDVDWGNDNTQSPENRQSNLISGPGRVWLMDNIDKIGQFPAADADQFLKPLDKFIELLAAATGTPLSYLHKVRGTSSTPLSGSSQKQTEVTLMKKIEARQRSFAATWRQALGFAMEILGHEVTVSINWGSSQAENDKETWEGVIAQQKAGVPIRQSLLEAGYTEAEVTSWGYTELDPNGKSYTITGNPHNPFHGQTVEGEDLMLPTGMDRLKQKAGSDRAQDETPEEKPIK